ncbi:MAG: hypothetical protein M3Q75_15100 [Gemmatimonadota bacterium]|nr:hypothetical protein [Gemmatimonadota bacterium]
MAINVTGQGTDDRGRRYVDLQVVGATAVGAASDAAADAAIAKIPFVGARQVLVTPATAHGKVNDRKEGATAVLSAVALKAILSTQAQTDTVGIRVVGP